MTWFEDLTGFQETGLDAVRRNLIVEGPTLKELWESVRGCTAALGKFTVRKLVAEVQSLKPMPEVASQFNLLEMISPSVSPEQGIGRSNMTAPKGFPARSLLARARFTGTISRRSTVSRDRQPTARLTASPILATPWAMQTTGSGGYGTNRGCYALSNMLLTK